MKRTARLLLAFLGVTAIGTAVAWAATSPTVATRPATGVGNGSAVLEAVVNPSGNQSSYFFQYGPTVAYGITTASHSVGHGTKAVDVKLTVGGLIPGTLYHFRVGALNNSGVAFGQDRTFTTTGHPPASVQTGPAVSVGKYSATPTGSVDPEGEATTWVVQYGLTTDYSVQTLPGPPLPAVITALPVSVPLSGLAPGKLFHYRIVATHGSIVSVGADQTFFTEPAFRRTPGMSVHTAPSRVTRKPYVFTTSGTLHGAGFVPEALRCTGEVKIRYYNGKRQVALAVAPVEPNCDFSTPASFRRPIGSGAVVLRVAIQFGGNGYLTPVARTNHVVLG